MSLSFQQPVSFQVQPNDIGTLQSPVLGDFNKDGKLDVVVADAASVGTTNQGMFAFAAGRGDGTFQLGASFNGGVFSGPAEAGDFNGDGNLDLVASNPGPADGSQPGNTVVVLLGKGDGTFITPAQSFTVGSEPLTIAVADFNGDGKSDVAVGNRSGNSVSVLLGAGSPGATTNAGALGAATTINVGQDPASLEAGDFNGDGKQDLLVGCAGGTVGLYFLPGNGDGTFGSAVITNGPPGVTGVGDFNGDGKLDAAISASDTGLASVVFGNGNGTFQASGTFPTTGFIALVGDYDGDGKPDVAYAGNRPNEDVTFVQILQNNGNGTFLPPFILNADSPGAGSVGDVNGDGKPDIVVTGFVGNNRVIDTIVNTSTPGASGSSDLTAQVTSSLPASVVGGAKGGKLAVRIVNSGTGLISGPVSVSLYASTDTTLNTPGDTLITTLTKKLKLKPGKSKNVAFRFTYPANLPDGQYSLLAQVDSANTVSESNEANNVAPSATQVTIAAPFIDLAPSFAAAPSAAAQGSKQTATILVQNNGNVPAKGSLTINLHLSQAADTNGPMVTTVTKNLSLKPGGKKSLKLKFVVPTTTPGNYSLVANVDAGNAFAESNETNNVIASPITVS